MINRMVLVLKKLISHFLGGDVPHFPSYDVYILQLICFVLMLMTSTTETYFDCYVKLLK